ncbi:MAG: hypothetical protein EA345_00785 [Halomonas sp.]|nr:hypothetical protein [Halomonas sp.]TVP52483.1 MAG: hypothetical protein EA345_00785 [Halomonas sp.]
MHRNEASITLNELIYSVIPNLNSAEKLVLATLENLIEVATNPMDILKRSDQREAFGLELHCIRMNLEHLLSRYKSEVEVLVLSEGQHKGPLLAPDPQEAEAIRSAMHIFEHVCAFQRGERPQPVARREVSISKQT